MTPPLHGFQPLVRLWFQQQVGDPTDIQCQAWPLIQAGEHVVLTAPTGSGKTLAAFLCALDRLIAKPDLYGKTRVLYVSPLKALNHDIQRNLLTPLAQLRTQFVAAGQTAPNIRVQTRSGDTDQGERRRMLRKPPEILITTPESLNLLLTSRSGCHLLASVQTLIIDEIHAILATKRGAHLMSAVERLPRLCGEFQRIALSATVKPLSLVGKFIGGYQLQHKGADNSPHFIARPVNLLRSNTTKQYRIDVISALERDLPTAAQTKTTPLNAAQSEQSSQRHQESFWHPLVEKFNDIIAGNRSTLLFVNSRRLCEKIAFKINQAAGSRVAYSHHGSLSREIRHEVEQKLKQGELKAIVATNSLELGIDIGALDEVVLIQSPPAISSAVQRVGRAGHSVGQDSYSRLFPTHPQDFLEAAALAKAVKAQDIEALKPVVCPLDVLAQVIISQCANQVRELDQLYNELRCCYSFHTLARRHFDLVVDMLCGRYADTRIRELKPRLSRDSLDNTVSATKGAVLALYMSGGTIPNRGYYQLRDANSNAQIGELDEEFVWEASIGQIFTLGTQHWRVERITHNDVFVTPGNPKNSSPPFWIAEHNNRDFHISNLIGEFLAQAEDSLQAGNNEQQRLLIELWQREHALDEAAAQQILHYLKQQREHTGAPLPHRHHIVIEHIDSGPGGHAGYQLVLHTRWGGKVNRPLSLALEEAWARRFGSAVQIYADNDCIVIQLPQPIAGKDILSLVNTANVEQLLKKRLEGSGFFAARFRECAGRALLLSKSKFNQRLPLWMSRLQAQKLHAAVNDFGDFPILLESWRSCLQDEFDLQNTHRCLAELEAGQIHWTETHSNTPSPFARSIAWGQINQYMYMEDRTPADARSHLHSDLLRDVVHSPDLRPTIAAEVLQQFLQKRQRLWAGYTPTNERDILDWLKERVILPLSEWRALLQAAVRDGQQPETGLQATDNSAIEVTLTTAPMAEKILRLQISSDYGLVECVLATERIVNVLAGFYGVADIGQMANSLNKKIALWDLAGNLYIPPPTSLINEQRQQWLLTALLTEWLSFYGPLTPEEIGAQLGLPPLRLDTALKDLLENQTLISGQLSGGDKGTVDSQQLCDADNFEALLRLQRAKAIPSFAPLPPTHLPLFIAERQGLTGGEQSVDGVYRVLETLRGYPAYAEQWEKQILPARIPGYDPSWLDSLMQEGELQWRGEDKQRLSFWFADEEELMPASEPLAVAEEGQTRQKTAPDNQVLIRVLTTLQTSKQRWDFADLLDHCNDHKKLNLAAETLSQCLWQLVWQGQISNDTFASVRRGLQHQFKTSGTTDNVHRRRSRSTRLGRNQYARRHASLPYAGRWYALPSKSCEDAEDSDLLVREEQAKDKARILLDRYGVVCRTLLQRESAIYSWREIFRALRLMELSGEILCGQFFSDLPGPQFIARDAFRRLQHPLPEDSVFWLNATDPASLCGLSIEAIKTQLPKRGQGTHLVYRGTELVLISERKGKSLRIFLPSDATQLAACFAMFRERLQRRFEPEKNIIIETINDEPATRSPYLDALRLHFDVSVDHRQVELRRQYQ